jgi:hypothetical protein
MNDIEVQARTRHRAHFGRIIRQLSFVVASFIFSLSLALTSILCLLQTTVFDEGFLRNQIEASGYADNLMETLQESLGSYGRASGFGETIFREAVSMDMLRADVLREVSRLYQMTDKRIDTSSFMRSLNQSLLDDVEKRGLDLSTEGIEAVSYLARVSSEAYASIVSIPFNEQIFNALSKLGSMNRIGIIGVGLLDIACIALLLTCASSSRKRVEGFMHAIAGAMLMMSVPAVFLTLSETLKRLPLTGKALYNLSQQYIKGMANFTLIGLGILSILWICALIYLISIIVAERNKNQYAG